MRERLRYIKRRPVANNRLESVYLGRSSAYLVSSWTRQLSFELWQIHTTEWSWKVWHTTRCFERLQYGNRRLVITQDLRKSTLGRSSAYLLCSWTRQFSFELKQNHATSGLGRCGTQQDVWNGFIMVVDGLWSPNTWVSLPRDCHMCCWTRLTCFMHRLW